MECDVGLAQLLVWWPERSITKQIKYFSRLLSICTVPQGEIFSFLLSAHLLFIDKVIYLFYENSFNVSFYLKKIIWFLSNNLRLFSMYLLGFVHTHIGYTLHSKF